MREQGTDGCGLINHVTTPWDAEIASINCPIDAASAADKEDSEGQCALDQTLVTSRALVAIQADVNLSVYLTLKPGVLVRLLG